MKLFQMVEVFKTNITKQKQAEKIIKKLQISLPSYKIDFDLEDCDNILRVENLLDKVDNEVLIQYITTFGFYIESLAE